MADPDIKTQSALREYLSYEADTGTIRWAKRRGQRAKAGAVAGHLHAKGYVRIVFCRRNYGAHRLAIFLAGGHWPSKEIDHINGDKADNRLCNLREVPREMNAQNVRVAQQSNKNGFLGVTRKGNRWQAQIRNGDRKMYLGLYPTQHAAHEAYITAKRKLHPGCTI